DTYPRATVDCVALGETLVVSADRGGTIVGHAAEYSGAGGGGGGSKAAIAAMAARMRSDAAERRLVTRFVVRVGEPVVRVSVGRLEHAAGELALWDGWMCNDGDETTAGPGGDCDVDEEGDREEEEEEDDEEDEERVRDIGWDAMVSATPASTVTTSGAESWAARAVAEEVRASGGGGPLAVLACTLTGSVYTLQRVTRRGHARLAALSEFLGQYEGTRPVL
ncbi:hypothetical protein HK405_005398, partial [Cladochytrium tenue]